MTMAICLRCVYYSRTSGFDAQCVTISHRTQKVCVCVMREGDRAGYSFVPTGPFYLRPNACPFSPCCPASHPFDQTPSAREAAGVIDADAPVCLLILSANLHLHTHTHTQRHTSIHGHAVPKIYALRSDSTNNRFDWHTPVPVKCISECVPVHIYVYRRGEQNRVKRGGGVRGEFSVRKNKGSWSYFTLSRASRPSISPSQVHLQYLQLFFFFPPLSLADGCSEGNSEWARGSEKWRP